MQEAVGIQEKGDSSNDMAKAAMVRMLAEMYAEEGTSDISKYAQAAQAYEHALEILGAVHSKARVTGHIDAVLTCPPRFARCTEGRRNTGLHRSIDGNADATIMATVKSPNAKRAGKVETLAP
jgi:hypothetical protein